MQCYLDGHQVNNAQARDMLRLYAERKGWADESWQDAWQAAPYSEESRDTLCELSDYRMEFVAN